MFVAQTSTPLSLSYPFFVCRTPDQQRNLGLGPRANAYLFQCIKALFVQTEPNGRDSSPFTLCIRNSQSTTTSTLLLAELPSPLRNIKRHPHDNSTDETRTRQSQNPTKEDLRQLFPVDTLQVHVHERNTENGTSNALRRRNRQTQTRRKQDRDGSAEFHAVPAGGRVLGNAVAETAHDVVAEGPEACSY